MTTLEAIMYALHDLQRPGKPLSPFGPVIKNNIRACTRIAHLFTFHSRGSWWAPGSFITLKLSR